MKVEESDYDSILESFEKIKQCPDSANLYFKLATVFVERGSVSKGFQSSLKAVQCSSYDLEELTRIADKIRDAGFLEQSYRLYKLALGKTYKNPRIYARLAQNFILSGNPATANALKAIQSSLEQVRQPKLSDSQLETYVALVDSLLRQSRFDEARRICKVALRVSPNSQQINNIFQSLPE